MRSIAPNPADHADDDIGVGPPLGVYVAATGGYGPGSAWDDDFLALGGRLRPVYGSQIMVDEDVPAYRVCCGRTTVTVTCTYRDGIADRVLVRCQSSGVELAIPFAHAIGPNLQAAVTGAARPLGPTT